MPEDNTILMEGVRIIFRNFAGNQTQYNRPGDRNFCVVLPDQLAEDLLRDGWNVKYRKPREEGDIPIAYLKVKVHYGKGRPPKVVMITSRGRTDLPEEMVQFIDLVDISYVDLIIRPYNWDVNGSTGISAYLKTIFVKVNEDFLELKYAELEEADNRDIIEAQIIEDPLAIER
jgi:hypothetical protein